MEHMMPPNGHPPFEKPNGTFKEGKTLAEISVTNWLTCENASFHFENGFLYLRQADRNLRVTLCRAFPFELKWELISVMDEEENEVGLIRKIEDFEGESKENLLIELKRRYYTSKITRILHMKERYGFSFWKVQTEEGEVNFVLRDTYKSILRVGENSVLMLDVDGNRFEIPDWNRLDRKSCKKLELYL